MVGQQDDEQVFPCLTLAECLHEMADAVIEISEGIEYGVVHPVDGYIPWLMAAQGGEADHERLAFAFRLLFAFLLVVVAMDNQVGQIAEGDIVSHAPLGRPLFFLAETLGAVEPFEARAHEVTAHVGEVDVAAIEIGGLIALALE